MLKLTTKPLLLIPTVAMLAPLLGAGTAYAQRVAASPSPITLNEGDSQLIQLRLDSPIICPLDAPTCVVDINFTSTDPAHVSFTPSTVEFLADEWTQPLSTTLQTTDDGVYNAGETVTVTGTAVSAAEYYNGYTLNIPLTINNNDPAPPVPTPVNKVVAAPDTGQAPANLAGPWVVVLMAGLAIGLGLTGWVMSSHRNS